MCIRDSFGEKAGLAGVVCYSAAALVLLLAIAGFVHALFTPKEKTVLGTVATPTPLGQRPQGIQG